MLSAPCRVTNCDPIRQVTLAVALRRVLHKELYTTFDDDDDEGRINFSVALSPKPKQ